jgi:uncharacterized protein
MFVIVQPPKPQMQTYTGRVVNPLALRVEDVCIEDIAHSLACSNRFCGHTKEPWNTAQHSVGVSYLVPLPKARKGLLHDGGEAYTGDMTKWLKMSPEMAAYREVDDRNQRVVYEAFGLDPDTEDPDIKDADRFMVRLEATDGYGGMWDPGVPGYEPLQFHERARLGAWRPMPWRAAELLFLRVFQELEVR